MELVFLILIILGMVFLIEQIFLFVGLPRTLGLLITSVIFGLSLFQSFVAHNQINHIVLLGNIGLLALLFVAGLEASWKNLLGEGKDELLLGFFGWIVPLFAGFGFSLLLGFSLIESLVVGICLSITAEATKAGVLLELGKIKTRVASALLGAGVLDDLFGLISFALMMLVSKTVSFSEHIHIVLVIIMFMLGVLVNKKDWIPETKLLQLKNVVFLFLVPFFFVSVGLHLQLDGLTFPFHIFITLLTVAIGGKIMGALITKPWLSFSKKQLILIGWGMNSRGAVELALALIAFQTGLISMGLYSVLVTVALITTVIFPIVFTK
ncbi:MAG: cation:proton antiporter, partial [Candidatus Nanoarchaeia archaeon]